MLAGWLYGWMVGWRGGCEGGRREREEGDESIPRRGYLQLL